MFSEESWIEGTGFEALADEEVTQCVIPSPWGLLQSMQSFLQLVHHVRLLCIFKPWRLSNLYFFLDITFEECTFHIHLIQLDIMMVSKRKSYTYRLKSSNRSKGFTEVYAFNLSVALIYEASFVPDDLTIFVEFVAEDPLCPDDIVYSRIRSLD